MLPTLAELRSGRDGDGDFSAGRYFRDKFTERNIWGVPSNESISALSEGLGKRKCLEVMGGSGFLSAALQSAGVDVICTDLHPGKMYGKDNEVVSYTEVQGIAAVEAVNKVEADAVIMSWPPYLESEGYYVLQAMKPGQLLVYIGEGEGGCTGCAAMHWALHRNFEEASDSIPWFSHWGIHDRCVIYKKLPDWEDAPKTHVGVCYPDEEEY